MKVLLILLVPLFSLLGASPSRAGMLTTAAPHVQVMMEPGVATAGQPVRFEVKVSGAKRFTVTWSKERHGRPETTFTYHVVQAKPIPADITITPEEEGTWYLLVDAPGMEQFSMIVPVLREH